MRNDYSDTKWLKIRGADLHLRASEGSRLFVGTVKTTHGIVAVYQGRPVNGVGHTRLEFIAKGRYKERRFDCQLNDRQVVLAARKFAAEASNAR